MDSIEHFLVSVPYAFPVEKLCDLKGGLKVLAKSLSSIIQSIASRGRISEHRITSCMLALKGSPSELTHCMESIPFQASLKVDPEACLRIMEYHHLRHAPVVDSNGRFGGEIRIRDISSFS
jgi:hypothetical protein